jgi:hypothetical protein
VDQGRMNGVDKKIDKQHEKKAGKKADAAK